MPQVDVREGSPEPLGVHPTATGVNVAVFSAHATAIEFCLFDDAGEREMRRVRLPERSGDVFHGHVAGIAVGARYGLRAHGPHAPHEGHRFNPAKLLIDPYASAIDRPFRLHQSMFAVRDGRMDDTDSAVAMPKAIVATPFEAATASCLASWPDTIVYELHVRGFTKRHPDVPETLRGTFAGLAQPAVVDYLVRLGVSSVEILPAAAWIEERHLAAAGLTNYWGYNPVSLMAPDPRLAPGGWPEVRAAVATLASAGIETIVDVVLNHTGEGDALGPTLSLRGLDNASYYRLIANDPARYVDDSGCGNTLALDRPPVLRLAMDTLRAWASLGGVHGFRFDLATAMGRRADGFAPDAPLLMSIAQDPLLRELKLIAEPWDVGPAGYQGGRFPAGWGEWNDRFRDDVRRFWRGDSDRIGDLATRLAGSADLFAAKRRPSRSVNYVVAHDGLTLADLVSYAQKHNRANGEDNRDGTDANFSWNNGVEGATHAAAIQTARENDQRALLATLLLARGTPMLAMGMERGHSQQGNNNAYAQDNETTWLDWVGGDARLLAWVRRLIAIRRDHAALRDDHFLAGGDSTGDRPVDVEWRRPDGAPMRDHDWHAPPGDALVVVLFAQANDDRRDRVLIAFNRGPTPIDVAVPPPAADAEWRKLCDSTDGEEPERRLDADTLAVAARSVVVIAEKSVSRRRGVGGDSRTLDRLARAAGIAPEWWEIDGTRHLVSDDTKRALLAAMRLPAHTDADARDSLARLTAEGDLRALPTAITSLTGQPIEITMPIEPGLNRRAVWLTVDLEDGSERRVRVAADEGSVADSIASDGRRYQAWHALLPALPMGRHRLRHEDCATFCEVTVAPMQCHLPTPLAEGQRLFGIAAQLYTLRRRGDQGIGDFTTLGELLRSAAKAGADAVGINPLHALFNDQRERASPYHPSDRRFLDPIYLDLTCLDDGFDGPLPQDLLERHAAAFRAANARPDVDYAGIWACKHQVLRRRFADFDAWSRGHPDALPSRAFRDFIARHGEALRRFAVFQSISEARPGEPWQRWPAPLRNADSAVIGEFSPARATAVRFHQYLQFLCDRQLRTVAEAGRSSGLALGLLRDLAVGAAPDGAEAWAEADLLARGVSVGAPPDPFAPHGQIWNLPPPDPRLMMRNGFAVFAGLLAANMRYAGGLRIDHVMGLQRLFWVPEGAEGSDGAYVAYPFTDLLRQVTLESQRARCLVVGEDLGTVPDGFRTAAAAAAVLSYRVLLLERDGTGFSPPSHYPAGALACVSTHDLPTLAGWWEGADIEEQARLGLIAPANVAAEVSERARHRLALSAALARENIVPPAAEAASLTTDLSAAVHAFLGRAPAVLAMVQADDLAGERRGVNLPGTDRERPNWRRKLQPAVGDLLRGDAASAIINALRSGRAGKSSP